jgi:hypothetical protein
VNTSVITYRLELKIYVDNMMCAIPIKFHSLVLTKEFTFVPKDSPGIAPWIIDVKV